MLIDIERVLGSGQGDLLVGNTAANTLVGNGGNDTLRGGQGADVLDGGLGTDTADYSTSTAVTVDLSNNANNAGLEAAGDTLTSIERVVGSNQADRLVGDALDNILEGGAGDDTLIGGDGFDQLLGGADTDTIDYSGSGSGVTVDLLSNSAPAARRRATSTARSSA